MEWESSSRYVVNSGSLQLSQYNSVVSSLEAQNLIASQIADQAKPDEETTEVMATSDGEATNVANGGPVIG